MHTILFQVRKFLHLLPPGAGLKEQEKLEQEHPEFQIDELFDVPDVGTVAGGLVTQGIITEGMRLNVGPFDDGSFRAATVLSIRRNRAACRLVRATQSAALALDCPVSALRKGMCLVAPRPPHAAGAGHTQRGRPAGAPHRPHVGPRSGPPPASRCATGEDVHVRTLSRGPGAFLGGRAGAVSVALVPGLRKTVPRVQLTGPRVPLPNDRIKPLGDDARGLAMTMGVPAPHQGRLHRVRDYQSALRAQGQQEFSMGSLEAYVNARGLAEGLERAGRDPTQARLRSALAGMRNWDMGGFVIDYSGQPPHVGSSFIDLGVLGNAGRFIG